MDNLGKKLLQFRKSLSKTQSELGHELNVPQATISKWEKGVQQPGPEHAAKLADLMGETVGELLGFGEAPQASYRAGPPSDATPPGRHPVFGCMKGTLTLLTGVDLTEPADPEWGKVYDPAFEVKLYEP